MTPVTAIVTELVSAGLCGEALVAAIARLEAAGVFAPVIAASEVLVRRAGRPGNSESAGAARTRAWRARRTSQEGIVTGVVTPVTALDPPQMPANPGVLAAAPISAPSQLPEVVTPVTVVTQKEVPPHPLKKNSSPKAPQRRQRHNPAFGGTPIVDGSRLKRKVAGDTPLHFELIAMHPERRVPDTGAAGWWWSEVDIAAAERQLSRRLVSLPRRVETCEHLDGEVTVLERAGR